VEGASGTETISTLPERRHAASRDYAGKKNCNCGNDGPDYGEMRNLFPRGLFGTFWFVVIKLVVMGAVEMRYVFRTVAGTSML